MRLTLLLGAAACGGTLLLPASRASLHQSRAVCAAPARAKVSLMANGASTEDTPVIETLLEERDELRRSRDFDGADAIRNELRERFKVIIDDRQKMWWVDDGSSRSAREEVVYQRTGSKSKADTAAIEALLVQRDELRRLRDFAGADTIRDELRFDHNVIIDDREKQWWTDDSKTFGDGKPGRYENDGGTAEGEVSIQIQALLDKRDDLRKARDFSGADDIRDQLRENYSVVIDDRRKTWWVDDGSSRLGLRAETDGQRNVRAKVDFDDFGPTGHDYKRAEDDKAELGENEIGDINELIRRRLVSKLNREFEEADALLEELNAMGVEVR